MRRISLVALSLLLIAAAPRRVVRSTPWQRPACDTVRGLDVITFSPDGVTMSANELPPPENVYVSSIVALDAPNVLVAAANFDVWTSHDAGCTWSRVASIFGASTLPSITPAAGGAAWVWTENQLFLYDRNGAFNLRAVPEPIRIVAADPSDGNRVRFFGMSGTLYESLDAGVTWTRRGLPEPPSIYDVAVDPTDFDHIVKSLIGSAQVSDDGGVTWSNVVMPRANFFDVAFAPHDPRVVWASGVSLETFHDTIFLSTDGGRTFAGVLEPPQGVAHDRNVLVPRFGGTDVVSFVAAYELFTYDRRNGSLTELKSPRGGITRALESPADARVVYTAVSNFIIVG